MNDSRDGLLRKGLVTCAVLDGLLFGLLAFGLIQRSCATIYNAGALLDPSVLMWLLYTVIILSLLPACLGLIVAKRWAIILSLAQTPFRVFFRLYTFSIGGLLFLLAGPQLSRTLRWVVVVLEAGRVYLNLVAFKRTGADDWHGPLAQLDAAMRRRLLAATSVVLILTSIGLGWDRRKPQEKLLYAVNWGHARTVQDLLAEGVDVNEPSPGGVTPLGVAVYSLRIDMTRLLLEHDADPNGKDEHQQTPLHAAALVYNRVSNNPDAQRDLMAIASLLLEKGAEVNARDDEGTTPLHHAATSDSTDLLKRLIDHGADLTALDKKEQTPLDRARKRPKPNEDVIKLLTPPVDKSASPDGTDSQDTKPGGTHDTR